MYIIFECMGERAIYKVTVISAAERHSCIFYTQILFYKMNLNVCPNQFVRYNPVLKNDRPSSQPFMTSKNNSSNIFLFFFLNCILRRNPK